MKTSLPLYITCNKKINLLNFTYEQMRDFFISIKEQAFCADQIMKWIYHSYCDDFDQMTNISKSLREKLKNICIISAPVFIKENKSCDGTIKWGGRVNKNIIETVYIPEKKRSTICISSQIGCPLKCTFCATGEKKFKGNLQVSEIIGQIWRASKIINSNNSNSMNHITNIVLMGMGEPLLNFKNVVNAIKIMLHKFGF
ncbi:MAG TPA: bifunctional tRNA (adenosine(37)-C2)-methyltransferase TrmG/ribosomal RNA large subunit methyltransferase RlmN, partial [Buchnera sp. (in: enterobacteria)]|nr:bifunctional tRNA (adenosine(37)-C2)-methyltransferase TrmG/ribosomal RNA large subunit methyltransferase RlmN [Buchnera sp. (in: enterobacteria)]